jgi:uncharacterized alpha-E superfamily protein
MTEQYLTANTASNLYWFGRYIERLEATLIEVVQVFDQIIDKEPDAGKKLYINLGVDLTYSTSTQFLDEAIFGEHSANLHEIVKSARENAIISRSYIDAEAFGAVIELHKLFEQTHKSAFLIDFSFIDEVLSLVREIWGGLSQRMNRRMSDYFIRLGKLVEKVDFHLRQECDQDFAHVIIDEIETIVAILAQNYTPQSFKHLESGALIEMINRKIDYIILDKP